MSISDFTQSLVHAFPCLSPLLNLEQKNTYLSFLLYFHSLKHSLERVPRDTNTFKTSQEMLLRSSSTPILKTYIPQSSPAVDSGHRIPSIPISLTSSPINKIQRASSDGNMRQIVISNRQKLPTSSMGSPNTVKEEIFTFPPLSLLGDVDDGGDDNGGGGVDRFGDWGQGKQRLDEYYRKMIKTYPGETLLLTNYAKFLKEVQGDFLKAEEYCGKAIIVKPDDGEILSLYGDLIWINHGDEALAQSYFDQAVKASPNNCYVLASYARYLWAAEKDDD